MGWIKNHLLCQRNKCLENTVLLMGYGFSTYLLGIVIMNKRSKDNTHSIN